MMSSPAPRADSLPRMIRLRHRFALRGTRRRLLGEGATCSALRGTRSGHLRRGTIPHETGVLIVPSVVALGLEPGRPLPARCQYPLRFAAPGASTVSGSLVNTDSGDVGLRSLFHRRDRPQGSQEPLQTQLEQLLLELSSDTSIAAHASSWRRIWVCPHVQGPQSQEHGM